MMLTLLSLALLQASSASAVPIGKPVVDQIVEATKVCELPEAVFTQFTDEPNQIRALIPKGTYAKRKEFETAKRISCIMQVGADRGYKIIVLGLRK